MRITKFLIASSLVVGLAACGGGGSGGASGSDQPNDDDFGLFSVAPSSITVASNTTSRPFTWSAHANEFLAFGASCSPAAGTYSVKETANVVVYNANSVSAAVLNEIAQYADASVHTLRARYSFAGRVGFDGTKVRVCASSNIGSNGSAGVNTLYVGTQNTGRMLAQLVHHEMAHLVQAQALQCRTGQYSFERWLAEGMALHVGQQDQRSASEVNDLKPHFKDVATGTPFGETNNTTYPVTARYPGYRLAFDTFLGEFKKTDVDVVDFLKKYGTDKGCPNDLNGNWKAEFDSYFAADLRGAGVLGTGFWETAPRYAGK